MKDLTKYQGIFPAFYACYDEQGNISPERVRALTEYFVNKGVTGLYVGGSFPSFDLSTYKYFQYPFVLVYKPSGYFHYWEFWPLPVYGSQTVV